MSTAINYRQLHESMLFTYESDKIAICYDGTQPVLNEICNILAIHYRATQLRCSDNIYYCKVDNCTVAIMSLDMALYEGIDAFIIDTVEGVTPLSRMRPMIQGRTKTTAMVKPKQ